MMLEGIGLILMVMWSAGCVGLTVYLVWFLFDEGDNGMAVAALLLGLPFAVVIAALPWGVMADIRSPDLVTLKKGDWGCTTSHSETSMILAGKVLVPTTRRVCDGYGRTR